MTFYVTVSRTWCTCSVTLEDIILISLRDLKAKLCKHNQKKGQISALHKILSKGGIKKRFVLCRNFRREFTSSITFEAFDSPERLWSKILPRHFTFAYCLISVSLYAMFKALAFRSLCLVQNKIDFVLSWPKCYHYFIINKPVTQTWKISW